MSISNKMEKGENHCEYEKKEKDMPWSLENGGSFKIKKYTNTHVVVTAFKTYHPAEGERLAILGNIEILGNWDITQPRYAWRGTQHPGSWSVFFRLPTDKMVELKWCVVRDREVVRVEDGPNHVLKVLSDPLLEALKLGISALFIEEKDEEHKDESQNTSHVAIQEKTQTAKQVLSDPLLEALKLGISALVIEEKDEGHKDESQNTSHIAIQEKTQTTKQHGRWCRLKKYIRRNLQCLRCV